MKTFAEAYAARGLDDWDVQQAIKRLQDARRRELRRPRNRATTHRPIACAKPTLKPGFRRRNSPVKR